MREVIVPAGATKTVMGPIYGWAPLAGYQGATWNPDLSSARTVWPASRRKHKGDAWGAIDFTAGASAALALEIADTQDDVVDLPPAPIASIEGVDASGVAPTGRPIQLAGIDLNGDIRPLRLTPAGDLLPPGNGGYGNTGVVPGVIEGTADPQGIMPAGVLTTTAPPKWQGLNADANARIYRRDGAKLYEATALGLGDPLDTGALATAGYDCLYAIAIGLGATQDLAVMIDKDGTGAMLTVLSVVPVAMAGGYGVLVAIGPGCGAGATAGLAIPLPAHMEFSVPGITGQQPTIIVWGK